MVQEMQQMMVSRRFPFFFHSKSMELAQDIHGLSQGIHRSSMHTHGLPMDMHGLSMDLHGFSMDANEESMRITRKPLGKS